MDLDSPTLTAFSQSTSAVGQEKHPTLTILWHPDPERVGERCQLAESPKAQRLALSRLSPTFRAAGGARDLPLSDPFLSRQSVLDLEVDPRGVTLFPAVTDMPVTVGTAPLLRPMSLFAQDLARGVVITLGRRIALCLHLSSHAERSAENLGLLGGSDAICSVRTAILSVADLALPVLIRGETGTGKELTVNAIVQNGSRRAKPLLAVNVGALQPQLAASELFGHEKGAFTGAAADRNGLFHDADGGTLFLDEVGLAPPDVQTALLRVLETGEVRRVGGRAAKRLDVRVLAATDSPLVDPNASEGAFSQALYQRLASFTIHLPPLRDRPEDLGVLLRHFLEEALEQTGETAKLHTAPSAKRPWLSADVFPTLAAATWPGNVRQLRNFALQMAISNRGADHAKIPAAMLPLLEHDGAGTPEDAGTTKARKSETLTHDVLVEALARHDYQPARVAKALRVSRTTVYEHIRRDPNLGLLARLSDEDFLRHVNACKGDLHQVAKRLRVSYRAVQLRYSPRAT